MIKAILFDFGQTLVDSADGFRAAEKDAQRKVHAALPQVRWDDFIERYRVIRKLFHDRSELSRVAIWQAVFAAFGRRGEAATLERWEDEYWACVNRHTAMFPETAEVLRKLAIRYRLALVTNTQGQTKSDSHRLSEFPALEGCFDKIVVAGEGDIAAKPDAEPFRLCLAGLDLSPTQAVFVGDDYRIDVCGALSVGMRAIWLKHHSVERRWPCVSTRPPVIRELGELLELDQLLAS